MASINPKYAIIGASPAGFTFALSLLQVCPHLAPQDIHIFETNPRGRRPGGPFSLTPNALRILAQLRVGKAGTSIYDLIKDHGFEQIHHTMRDEQANYLGSLPMGSKSRWGYNALRIERGEVLRILEAEAHRLGIPVSYETSLREVTREDSDGVEFLVRSGGRDSRQDSTTVRARRVIGADGVHSRTRAFVCGAVVSPTYSGNFMAAAYIPRAALRWGESFAAAEREREWSLSVTGPQGTLMLIPADASASVMQVGRQWAGAERSREGWEALAGDKDGLRQLFQRDMAAWSDFPRSVLAAIRAEDIWGVWAFYALPKLDRWVSAQGKVVIIGDAAHTVVPAAAQGATQAIEDAWSLAQTFAGATGDEPESLKAWEAWRMARLEKIAALSVQLMNVRLPPVEQAKLGPGMVFDVTGSREDREERLDWLYGAGVDNLSEARVLR